MDESEGDVAEVLRDREHDAPGDRQVKQERAQLVGSSREQRRLPTETAAGIRGVDMTRDQARQRCMDQRWTCWLMT